MPLLEEEYRKEEKINGVIYVTLAEMFENVE